MDIDKLKEKLCIGEFSHLIIQSNPHHANYESVESFIEWRKIDDEDFISLDEKKKCLDENKLWLIQWYPNSPIGFEILCASTFESIYNHTVKVRE